MHRTAGSAVALVVALVLGTPVEAQTRSDGFGSGIYQTLRNCPVSETAACNGVGFPVIDRNTAGGPGEAATTRFAPVGAGLGSSAVASVSFGGLGLPELRLATTANPINRVGNNVYAYQTYTYTGDDEFDLLLSGSFHIVDSSSDRADGVLPNGVVAFAGFAVWNAEDFFSYASGSGYSVGDIIGQPANFGAGTCDLFEDYDSFPTGGPRAIVSGGRALAGGANQSIGLAQHNCYEETLTLEKGDRFVIASYAQLIANRGGWADALGTFRLGLDPSIDPAAAAAFAQSITFAWGVPEPATWGLMILGFAVIGAAMRRRATRIAYT